MKSLVITVVFLVCAVDSLPSVTSPLPVTPIPDSGGKVTFNTLVLVIYDKASFVHVAPLFPFGINAGDSKLPRVDDGSSTAVVLQKPILFYGKQETSLYVRIKRES